MTEITKINECAAPSAWVLYDGECTLCSSLAHRFARTLEGHGFVLDTLRAPWACRRAGLSESDIPQEMAVITQDDIYLRGPDALRHILACIWWTRPLAGLSRLVPFRPAFDRVYRGIAKRRHCIGGACSLGKTRREPDVRVRGAWIAVLVSTCVGTFCWHALVPWVRMWLLAFLVFGFAKVSVLAALAAHDITWPRRRRIAFVMAWPGMDPEPFLARTTVPTLIPAAAWASACLRMLVGLYLIWGVAPLAWPQSPLLAGWLGMIGFVTFLHFGAFRLLALYWQGRGIDAEPIMRAPMLATSLADFWGKRWNRAFRSLAHRFVYRPACRRFGRHPASALAFLVSGIIHEAVISVPAGAGYGGPTFYFLLQCTGLHLQRVPTVRRLGLDRGIRGWLITMLFLLAPIGYLFHRPFIEQVFLPFMHVLQALKGGVL